MARATGRTDGGRALPALLALGWSGAVAAVATIVTVVHHQLWRARPGVSWHYGGDGMFHEALVANVLDGGWYYDNSRLGFPYGQDLTAYPIGDHLTMAGIRVLGVFADSSSVVTNLLYFATYPLVAVTAFLAARWLGLRRPTAAAVAILYAFTPFHLDREAGHLFFSVHPFVPLGVAVLARQLAAPLVAPTSRRWRPGTGALVAVAVVAALALTGVYNSIFFLLLAAAVVAVQALGGRAARPALVGTVLIAVAGAAVTAVALAPAVLRDDGGAGVVERSYADSERYGLRIDRLVLPQIEHRIERLRGPIERIDTSNEVSGADTTSALGLVAAAGFVGAFVHLVRRCVDRRHEPGTGGGDPAETSGDTGPTTDPAAITSIPTALALLVAAATAIGTVAGVGGLLAALGSAQIRAWNRISIFIAFAALVLVGLAFDRWLDRDPSVRGRNLRLAALAVAVTIGLADQLPVVDTAARDVEVRAWQRDRGFFAAMEAALEPGAAVLTLPAVPFPEHPSIGVMRDYDHLRAYLHTDGLRFSYGASKASVPLWDLALTGRPAREVVAGAVVAGFDAIYANTAGYVYDARPLDDLRSVLGPADVTSDDGALLAWDLAPIRRRLAGAGADASTADVVLARVDAIVATGFGEEAGVGFRSLLEPEGRLELRNITERTFEGDLEILVSSTVPARVELIGDAARSATVGPGRRTTIRVPVTVPPGGTSATVRADVAPGREDPGPVQLFTADLVADPDLAEVADTLGLP